jgi:hypothetical protein
MRRLNLIGFLLLCSLCYAGIAFGLTLDFSNLPGTTITFYGNNDTFAFVPDPGNDFQITSTVNGTDPDTVGLLGSITGIFTIGNISQIGSMQSAPVTGSGVLTVLDESSKALEATLQWIDVTTIGIAGAVNLSGTANLSDFSYVGNNADLLQFLNGGAVSATFQFVPAKSLTDLTADGTVNSTSYSGTMTPAPAPVPEPATLLLMGTGLIGLGGVVRKKFKK